MNRMKRGLLAVTLAGIISFTPSALAVSKAPVTSVMAHSGRTDSQGGHHDNRNVSGLGSYHYHCGGYPAHLHENGVCPYTDGEAAEADSGSSVSQSSSSNSSGSKSSVSRSIVKKVQKKLNRLGYNCGKPDGILGTKTKKALKKFQKDNDLKADGVIGKKTLKALGISEA